MTESTHLLSPAQRRERNRQEVIAAILDVAIAIMREEGVAALNLHEVGRRVGMRAQSLYKYFPSKSALYDALFREGIRRLRENDRQVWEGAPPTWERLHAWLTARLAFAREQGPLYDLVTGIQVPGFSPSEQSLQEASEIGEDGAHALSDLVDVGILAQDVVPREAMNMLLATSRGIIGETLGKEHLFPTSGRFRDLIPQFVDAFRVIWSP